MNPLLQTLSAAYFSFALGIIAAATGLLETNLTATIVVGTSIGLAVILAIAGRFGETI